MRQRLSVEAYTKGVLSGDTIILSRAITLIESKLKNDKLLAKAVLENILPYTGKAMRVGITGVPGVGKSTFIEAFGKHITSLKKKVAVLTVDPSSKKTGGSILADKTRMEELSRDPLAFIRPSASGLSLGGVARSTRETMLLCEAAGYEVIIIETVGVGQSETLVKGMSDFFLLLMLAGAGDELQGIKKGIMEMADAVAINKADGANKISAELAVTEYQNALHLFPKSDSDFITKVVTCSALEGTGIASLWELITEYQQSTIQNGYFEKNRQAQNLEWMHNYIRQLLEGLFYENTIVKKAIVMSEKSVKEGNELPVPAAELLLDLFMKNLLK
ncbi:methylmalonyl Co-A mutase-associated GTPase MeaB [Dyadobacter frigoris]|uniref:Methylmalonyl Co-A mutase-associated GTPase MeaB n=1 Tax=Dyadobacter frigoris TaxID=2576211 RepID=A0A4V6BJG2_9BACT|nr:methylmalonyl Co-A mutase-associated GTPase MeaB [Dyadobacter frigoris]TKT93793.1 methylmalonyl Co-A mutase-associated GTPase MeaB [Dyadobacter frigoris]GLU50993.1 ATPase/protein kinase [Dyadobacter frigoris]